MASGIIEDLMLQLKQELTIVLVSHNMGQAARVSDQCALFLQGHVVEFGPTRDVMENPKDPRTRACVARERVSLQPAAAAPATTGSAV